MLAQQLLIDLINVLGKENVIADGASLKLAAQTNYPTTQQIPLIARPGNTEELQDCILLANRYNHPVYVTSQGKNWGYGSRVPVQDNSILLELKKMDRILDFDERLGYLTIEPGVTFRQAFRFLRERNSELLLSITGGAGESSIVGNALDRGIGTGVYADRFSSVCGLEVVLPDGEVICTGFERFENSLSGKLSRWGKGPSLDGLFSQSNLGIVTKMTIWLMKCPPCLQLIFYKIRDTGTLARLINELQDMAMDGLVRPTITLYNDMRVLSSLMQFPFHETQPGERDPDDLMEHIKANLPPGKIPGAWNGEISIRAVSKEHADLQSRMIAERIKELAYDLTVITVSKSEIMQLLDSHYREPEKNNNELTLRNFLLGKYLGIPSNSAIGQVYWRKRKPIPRIMDPDKDKCGVIWFCPVVPFREEDIIKAVNIIKNTVKKYAFEAGISLQCLSERSIHIIASINWDREIEQEDKDAALCYREVNTLLEKAGYYAYRGATLDMPGAKTQDAYGSFLRLIKQAVDPNHILSPGKYVPEV